MRLLNVRSLTFNEFQTSQTPSYVIASHRWHQESEVTYRDVLKRRNTDKHGYKKIEAFAAYVVNHVRSIEWLWVDTCCIDRTNSQELTESINSMFDWYRNASLCIAYLEDVQFRDNMAMVEQSEWFRRGWTLQELLAPWVVVFVTQSWEIIGSKGDALNSVSTASQPPRLEEVIARVTKIPLEVLYDVKMSASLSVEERLTWMDSGRRTSREEDMSYALYGLFDVAPGANYGERYERARQRLISAIRDQEVLITLQAARLRTITDWLSASDPWSMHATARSRQQPFTNDWLVQSGRYQEWKSSLTSYLWIHGKPGCGKTVLCSEAIEDIRAHCARYSNSGFAIFYFSFTDDKKQRHIDILRSLLVQLCRKGPALSRLQHAYERYGESPLSINEMEDILFSCLEAYKEVFLLMDALDECPKIDDTRQAALEWLATLTKRAPHLKCLVTSREEPDIRETMELMGAEVLHVDSVAVDTDIRHYIEAQMLSNRRLRSMTDAMKKLVLETICSKSNGMFRWAYCQLNEVKQLKSTKPSYIERALSDLPPTLDATYERMLSSIEDRYSADALTLLRWLAYAESPLTLSELAEAIIIDLTAGGRVATEDRPGTNDILEILSGLVVVKRQSDSAEAHEHSSLARWRPQLADEDIEHATDASQSIDHHVRLAHFSVLEYLQSTRILLSDAKAFHLQRNIGHEVLCQSCLVYLTHYSRSAEKRSTIEDFVTFPLLQYAAKSWFCHSVFQESAACTGEMNLLCDQRILHDWLQVYQPDRTDEVAFGELNDIGSSLYYASFLGLGRVVHHLLNEAVDIAYPGGTYGNPLQAASYRGHKQIVQMLIHAGADIDAHGGMYSSALRAASAGGYEDVMQLLQEAGAHPLAESAI